MRILVAITEVATADDTIEFSDKSITESNFTYGLNEWDEYAIAVSYTHLTLPTSDLV